MPRSKTSSLGCFGLFSSFLFLQALRSNSQCLENRFSLLRITFSSLPMKIRWGLPISITLWIVSIWSLGWGFGWKKAVLQILKCAWNTPSLVVRLTGWARDQRLKANVVWTRKQKFSSLGSFGKLWKPVLRDCIFIPVGSWWLFYAAVANLMCLISIPTQNPTTSNFHDDECL